MMTVLDDDISAQHARRCLTLFFLICNTIITSSSRREQKMRTRLEVKAEDFIISRVLGYLRNHKDYISKSFLFILLYFFSLSRKYLIQL